MIPQLCRNQVRWPLLPSRPSESNSVSSISVLSCPSVLYRPYSSFPIPAHHISSHSIPFRPAPQDPFSSSLVQSRPLSLLRENHPVVPSIPVLPCSAEPRLVPHHLVPSHFGPFCSVRALPIPTLFLCVPSRRSRCVSFLHSKTCPVLPCPAPPCYVSFRPFLSCTVHSLSVPSIPIESCPVPFRHIPALAAPSRPMVSRSSSPARPIPFCSNSVLFRSASSLPANLLVPSGPIGSCSVLPHPNLSLAA